jgi:hypothetical protein
MFKNLQLLATLSMILIPYLAMLRLRPKPR